jgi:TPR repeat protein
MTASYSVTWPGDRGRRAFRLALACAASISVLLGLVAPASALGPLPHLDQNVPRPLRVSDSGIDIVRIPPKPKTDVGKAPAAAERPVEPKQDRGAQPLGRVLKLPVKVAGQPSDTQRGWLGVRMDPLELPLALSLGLPNANGALIVGTTAGGPAAQAGLRYGDIVVAINSKAVEDLADIRQRVSSAAPGSQITLDVWRGTADNGDFVQMLRGLADGGNAYIMFRLGRMHATGAGVQRDDLEAVRWYRKGAAAGNLSATTALALMLIEGRGANKDTAEGIRLLRAAVDKGSPEAMHSLGLATLEGRLVSKDPLEAVRLFTAAGDAGYAPAMVDVGLMYDNANGVPQDYNKAAQWYRKAADLGNSAGMVNLGFLYARGKGVEQSDQQAVFWYKKAAAEGNAAGLHNLAAMADNGRGFDRDPDLAADLMLQALELRYDFSYKQMTQQSKNWTVQFRRALQRKLREAGVYSGSIDGEFGESTISAIDAYINRSR